MHIDGWGVGLLIVVAVIVPWLAFRSRGLLAGGGPVLSRPSFYWQTAFMQLLLYALALTAATTNTILIRLIPQTAARWWPAAALFVAAAAALHLHWGFRDASGRERLRALLPQERPDVLPYVVLCCVAAVSEEVVYRGVVYRLLLRLGLTTWEAVAVAAIVFALGHALQGWSSVFVIALFAVAFHAVVIYAGALMPAIVAHAAYDLYAGFVIARSKASR